MTNPEPASDPRHIEFIDLLEAFESGFRGFRDTNTPADPTSPHAASQEPIEEVATIGLDFLNLNLEVLQDPDWLIGPCIRPGDLTYFIGRDGVGKSTLIADLVASFLNPDLDTCWKGAWRINRKLLPPLPRALIINAETSGADAWARHLMHSNLQHDIAPLSDEDRDIRSRCLFYDAQDFATNQRTMRKDSEALAAKIIEAGVNLVVIDPVFNFFDPPDAADPNWVNNGLRPLAHALKAALVNVIAIAHPNAQSFSHGRKGGPTLDQAYRPFGSSQQNGLLDARFAVQTVGDQPMVEVIKLKSRRAGSWIPNKKARIRLPFSPVGGGYLSFEYLNCAWEYDNPDAAVLSPKAREMLLALPIDGTWRAADVEARGIRKKTFEEIRDLYYLPQGLLESETLPERGAPRVYRWTDKGRTARLRAEEVDKYTFVKQEPKKPGRPKKAA